LPETIPEKNAWIKRSKLLGISGRSRKIQLKLAQKYGIKNYSPISGGCLLTDPLFSKRLKDLLNYGNLDVQQINLLKLGRHFRISKQLKLIVARDEKENKQLYSLRKKEDCLLRPKEVSGPLALLKGKFRKKDILLAAKILCRYADRDSQKRIKVIFSAAAQRGEIETGFAKEEVLAKYRI